IENKPSLATEKGDRLIVLDLDLSGKWITIVYPNIHINTTWAYEELAALRKNQFSPWKATSHTDLADESSWTHLPKIPLKEWKNLLKNDLEEVVFGKFPEIATIKNKLYESEASYASMSGSGSSVYGIFEKKPVVPFDPAFRVYTARL